MFSFQCQSNSRILTMSYGSHLNIFFNHCIIPNRGHADIGNRQNVGQVKTGVEQWRSCQTPTTNFT